MRCYNSVALLLIFAVCNQVYADQNKEKGKIYNSYEIVHFGQGHTLTGTVYAIAEGICGDYDNIEAVAKSDVKDIRDAALKLREEGVKDNERIYVGYIKWKNDLGTEITWKYYAAARKKRDTKTIDQIVRLNAKDLAAYVAELTRDELRTTFDKIGEPGRIDKATLAATITHVDEVTRIAIVESVKKPTLKIIMEETLSGKLAKLIKPVADNIDKATLEAVCDAVDDVTYDAIFKRVEPETQRLMGQFRKK